MDTKFHFFLLLLTFCCASIYLLSTNGPKSTTHAFIWSKSSLVNVSEEGERKRFPRALIIGARKCGTRALIEFINIHPMVRVCHEEVNFFNVEERYFKGYHWYLDQMPLSFSDQVTIEKTPNYFPTKSIAARRVLEMNPDMKLVLIVRDPVIRIVSDYVQTQNDRKKRKLSVQPPFEQLAVDNVTGQVNAKWRPVWVGQYAVHLSVWLQYFPRSQILVLSDERLTANPRRETAKLEKFLGLRPKIRDDHFELSAAKRGFVCFSSFRKTKLRCLGATKGAKHPKVNATVLRKLKHFYEPFNKQFFDLVQEDFGWNNE